MLDPNYLKKDFIDQAKPALEWFDFRWGISKGGLIVTNKVNDTDNSYINSNNGNVTALPSTTSGYWAYTDYIRIEGGSEYLFTQIDAAASQAGFAWYDANQVYISGVNGTTIRNSATNIFTAPDNAVYLRHSFRIDEGYNVDWRNTVSITKVV